MRQIDPGSRSFVTNLAAAALSMMTMKGTAATLALALFVSLACSASAQPTVEQEVMPDLDYYATAIDHRPGDVRALFRATAAGGHRVGGRWLTQGDLDLLLGTTEGQRTVFKLRSQLSLIGDFAPGDDLAPATATLGGKHRFHFRYAAGGFEDHRGQRFADRALGADLEVEGFADHGRIGYGTMRFDVGDGRFGTFGGSVAAWLRRNVGGRQAFVMPLRFRYEGTRLEPGAWTRRIGASTGWGVKHYFAHHYHGYVEGLGIGWDRFAPVAGLPVDRFELRALHLDNVTFRGWGKKLPLIRDEDLLFLRTWIGGHWLVAERGERSLGTLAFDVAVGLRFPFQKARAELIVGGGREGAPSSYSGTFVDRYRAESRASITLPKYGLGSDTRVVSAWQSNLEEGSAYGQQLAVSSSVWFDVCHINRDDGSKSDRRTRAPAFACSLGIYQRAQHGLPQNADAFVLDDRWRHDIGLFLRLRGGERGGERNSFGPAGFSPWE